MIENISGFCLQLGAELFSVETSMNLLYKATNITLNFYYTLPFVLKFLNAYRTNDQKLILLWSLSTAAVTAASAIASTGVISILSSELFPAELILTPSFFLGCLFDAGFLLLTAIVASKNAITQRFLNNYGYLAINQDPAYNRGFEHRFEDLGSPNIV